MSHLCNLIRIYNTTYFKRKISVDSKIYLEVTSEGKIQFFTCIIDKFDLFQMLPSLFAIRWLHILMSRGPQERGRIKSGIKCTRAISSPKPAIYDNSLDKKKTTNKQNNKV